MPLHAQSALIETSKDPRKGVRHKLLLPVSAVQGVGLADAVIHNLSESGLLIETARHLAIGETIEVQLPDTGTRAAKVVWGSDDLYGCEFVDDLPVGAVSAARLRAPFDMERIDEADELPGPSTARTNDEKLPFPARLYTVLGLAVLSWAVMAGVVAWIVG